MGGERQDKKLNCRKQGTKKKQEGNGAEDQSSNKSFGGAGLRQKADTTKPRWKGKFVPGQHTPRCAPQNMFILSGCLRKIAPSYVLPVR